MFTTDHKDDNPENESFFHKLKKPFRELEEKLEGTHLHDAKVHLTHKKHQIGKFANLVSSHPRFGLLNSQAPDTKLTRARTSSMRTTATTRSTKRRPTTSEPRSPRSTASSPSSPSATATSSSGMSTAAITSGPSPRPSSRPRRPSTLPTGGCRPSCSSAARPTTTRNGDWTRS